MLGDVFKELDEWVVAENLQQIKDGHPQLPPCEFKVVGQTALIEAKLNLEIAATADIDALNNASHEVRAKFNELLKTRGQELDPLSNEIWMPDETNYSIMFGGIWVKAFLAQPEFIMLSKAKMALPKNKFLLQQYLAKDPPESFFELCKKYNVNLYDVLK